MFTTVCLKSCNMLSSFVAHLVSDIGRAQSVSKTASGAHPTSGRLGCRPRRTLGELAAPFTSREAAAPPPPANFTGLVLGCIEAKFCKKICV